MISSKRDNSLYLVFELMDLNLKEYLDELRNAGSGLPYETAKVRAQLPIWRASLASQLQAEVLPRPCLRPRICPLLAGNQPKGLCSCKGRCVAANASLIELL